MTSHEFAVSVEAVADGGHGPDSLAIKIGTPVFEVNIVVPVEDADRLKRVRQTPWLSGALHIGASGNMPAWWCVSGEADDAVGLSILLGHDDQTWDIALNLSLETIDLILKEVETCVRQPRRQDKE